MYPSIALELVTVRQEELMREAENHRRARLVRGTDGFTGRWPLTAAHSLMENAHVFGGRARAALGHRLAGASTIDACCA